MTENEKEEILNILRLLQWRTGLSSIYCPICSNHRHQGHADDCRIAASIKKLS